MIDLVSVVEAAYRTQAGVELWLHGVAAAVRPALDKEGTGVFAVLVDHSPPWPCAPRVLATTGVGITPALLVAAERMRIISTNEETQRRFRAAGPFSSFSRTFGHEFTAAGGPADILEPTGVCDGEYIFAGAFDDYACVVSSARAQRVNRPRNQVRTLEHVAAHIAAGARLLAQHG